MIRVTDLHCHRDSRVVLNGVSLDVQSGQVLGILGANGAGKSSLLAAIAGDLPSQQGQIELNGTPLARIPHRQLARLRALLTQSPSLAFDLPVPEVVAMGAYPFDELDAAQVEALVEEALSLAEANDLTRRHYAALSGGEQQRVQFARVLVQTLAAHRQQKSALLLLDEPTASLDPRHQHGLLKAVSALAQDKQISALVVLHDVNLAAQWCDSLLLLHEGKVLAAGTPAQVLTAMTLETAYGMPARILADADHSGRLLVMFG